MSRAADALFRQTLERLERENRLRATEQAIVGRPGRLRVGDREVLDLCSNDYLGLSASPKIAEAASNAALSEGTGSGASRLVTGTRSSHLLLEEETARWLGCGAALFFSSGYHANVGVLDALAGPGDLIVSDEFNHASIIDGCRLSGARTLIYPHLDAGEADRLLSTPVSGRRVLVTESLFSMHGDAAPLEELADAAQRRDAVLVLDEAHAVGVVGEEGRGLAARMGLAGRVDVLIGTFGKAAGVFGAFAAGSDLMRAFLVNRARTFVFTTSPPPPIVAACRESVRAMRAASDLRERLQSNVRALREGLADLGFAVQREGNHIIPLVFGDEQAAIRASEILLDNGVMVRAIRPPSVPAGASRLRITGHAAHGPDDLRAALAAFENVAREPGLTSSTADGSKAG